MPDLLDAPEPRPRWRLLLARWIEWAGRPAPGLRAALILAVLPLVLVSPALVHGKRFLPQLPVSQEPLASESPERADVARERQNFNTTDRLFPALTDQRAIAAQVRGGTLPTWEPLLGSGLPLFATSIAAPAYPPNWLTFFLRPDRAAGPLAMVTLGLAGIGMWFFLRRSGLPRGPALVGALALQVGGWGIANLHDFMKVDAALWLPWSLWAVEGLARRKPFAGFALTVSVGLSLLAGFPPIALFALATTATYAVWRLAPRRAAARADDSRAGARGAATASPSLRSGSVANRSPRSNFGAGDPRTATSPSAAGAPPPDLGQRGWRSVLRAAAFAAFGLAIGAWQLLPMAEASRESLRTPQDAAAIAAQALPVGTSLGFVLPDLLAPPTEPLFAPHHPIAWWLAPLGDATAAQNANPLEWNTYAGVLVVLLALTALVAAPRRAAFPALLLVAVVGFAQGWPVLRLLYHLPVFSLGAPGRALSVAWVLWPWLAAIGAAALVERKPRALAAFLGAGFALAAAGFWAWSTLDPASWAAQLEQRLATGYRVSIAEVRAFVDPHDAAAAGERLRSAGGVLFTTALGALGAGLAGLLWGAGRGPRSWKLFCGLAALSALAATPLAVRAEAAPEAAGWTALALALGALVPLAWSRKDRATTSVWLPLLLFLAAEGVIAAEPHLVPRDLAGGELFPASPAMEAVREATGDGRVLRFGPLSDVTELARPGLPHAYGIGDLSPYTVFTPRYLVELFEAVDPRTRYLTGVASLVEPAMLDHPVLDLARVTCILSRTPLQHRRLELVAAFPGFHVYHRTGVPPAVRWVPGARGVTDEAEWLAATLDPGRDGTREVLLRAEELREVGASTGGSPPTELVVSRRAPHRLDVGLRGATGGWLVMHGTPTPNWKATVNGEDVEVLRADYALRALRLPAGDLVVRTWYEPWSLRIGLGLCVLGFLASLLLTHRSWPR